MLSTSMSCSCGSAIVSESCISVSGLMTVVSMVSVSFFSLWQLVSTDGTRAEIIARTKIGISIFFIFLEDSLLL